MRQKVTFETNIPQIVSFEFPEPKEVASVRGGTQWQYFVHGDRIMWLDDAAKRAIDACHPLAGDQIELCKREVRDGNRKRVEWQAQIWEPAPTQVNNRGPQPAPARKPPAQAQAAPVAQRTNAAPPASQDALSFGIGHALKLAYDAAVALESYSGGAVHFDAADLRAMAATLLINTSKERAA
jgi:hypothetical protein